MAARESFIPLPRHVLLEACLSEKKLLPAQGQAFQNFCQSLSIYYHLKYHSQNERLKEYFLLLDPEETSYSNTDLDTAKQFIQGFSQLLENANFFPLSKEILQKAFATESLIALRTEVNFEDFAEVICYCQGDIFQDIEEKKFFRTVTRQIDIYERVALLVQFKSADYFKANKIDPQKLSFKPGKIYISLYKNIPKKDVEFIFPNVEVNMLRRDKLLFWIPAIAAGIPTVLRVVPQLLLIAGVTLFIVFKYLNIEVNLPQVQPEEVQDVMPVLVAMLSIILGCGGFAAKQYSNYKFKYIKFQKEVTDTLFFRNLASNFSVIQLLIDAAEEEQCKEIILVYYFLLQQNQPIDPQTLDQQIEIWVLERFATTIDFDITSTLKAMEKFDGDRPIVTKDETGKYQAVPLEMSQAMLRELLTQSFT
ncbi:MAG: DUF3754 domain-containing protein [Limnothrix sp. RL_2_0]|nr:DUF3754 domain-containing protein [Limnothrix sp. RL_2_0]